ncbi:cytidylyltransferase domain-containing protein, partial [Streptococcus pyogenes]
GGSKRIPRKNIKPFHGKPMIAYSIEAAIASGCFDKVIVSTDDQDIADVAKQYGAEVPFLRPADIADDYATTMDVMAHAIQWCQDA